MNNIVAQLEGHPAGLCTLGLIEKQKGEMGNLTKTVYCSPYLLCQVIPLHIKAAGFRNRSVSVSSHLFLSGENQLQLVNAFKQVWHKSTDKNALCPLQGEDADYADADDVDIRMPAILCQSKSKRIKDQNCSFITTAYVIMSRELLALNCDHIYSQL